MKKAFIVSYGGGHANIIKNIYRQLEQADGLMPTILALTASVKIYDREQIPYKTYCDYLPVLKAGKEIAKLGEYLAATGYDEKSGIPKEQIAAYLGVGYYDGLVDCGMDEEKMKQRYLEEGRKVFCPVHAMKEILEYERPSVVVLTSGVRSEKAAGIAANKLGIPVVRIVDHLTLAPLPYKAVLCVMNETVKEALEKQEWAGDTKIFVTGQPVFEDDLRLDPGKLRETEKKFRRDQYKNVIIYLEQPDYEDQQLLEPEFMNLAKKNKDNLYIIKLHPNQSWPNMEARPENVIVEREYELKYLLAMSDAAITGFSTSGMEAAFLGKPLIVTELFHTLVLDYSDYGIAVKITRAEELEKTLSECLDGDSEASKRLAEGRRKFQNRKNAAENVVRVIEENAVG